MAKKTSNEKQTLELYDRMADALESISGNYAGATLPEVTSDDNGDVLSVVSGAWAKADPPSSLPTVTSDDNGDVLTVVEGGWAKAAPASGGNAMIIDYNAVTFPSFNDILAAVASGKIVMVEDTSEPDSALCYYFIAANFDDTDNNYKIFFAAPPDQIFTLSATTKTDPMTT